MAVFVLYQGQRFEAHADLGDADAVQDHIQQSVMWLRFIESAWIDGGAADLSPAWIPFDEEGERYPITAEGASSTSTLYTVFPHNSGDAKVYSPFIRIRLADDTTLRIFVQDALSIAVLESPGS